MLMVLPGIDAGPSLFTWLTVEVDARRIVGEHAFGSGNHVDAVVGMRIRCVVLERDGETVGGLDDRRIHVAVDVFLSPPRVGCRQLRLAVLFESALRRTD